MGLYTTGIYGLEPMKLKMHESNARNIAIEYKRISTKLDSLKNEHIGTNLGIKKQFEGAKDNWDLSYKSEDGNVKSIIDSDIKNINEQISNLTSQIDLLLTQSRARTIFYETLSNNCANSYTAALNECNSSNKDFWHCAKFSIKGQNVTYTISESSDSHGGGLGGGHYR